LDDGTVVLHIMIYYITSMRD